MGSSTDFVNNSKTQVTGRSNVTWSVAADTATTALFCLNTVISGVPGGAGAERYKADVASDGLGLVVKVTVIGKTLTLS